MTHEITRHRHETRRRNLTVREKIHITPSMIRIVLEGNELEGFTSFSPDDHIKLIVPESGDPAQMRDYTPRRYDAEAQTLAVDFAVHDAGPATLWAVNAAPGDPIQIGGPRGSAVISLTYDWWLLIGDETALPALGRRVEELPASTRAIVLGAVTSAEEEQVFTSNARLEAHWVHRPAEAADDATSLIAALQSIDLPQGDGFVWIAAEASVARALRDHVINQKGHKLEWTKAAGYWRKGVADNSDKAIE